jgi:hypothetical protein
MSSISIAIPHEILCIVDTRDYRQSGSVTPYQVDPGRKSQKVIRFQRLIKPLNLKEDPIHLDCPQRLAALVRLGVRGT